ncbi:MAG: L,D-transpeptidase [Candidatus Levybacteria bacterium]|nr:L,D-transpeptidase [Candidatus Levybacteria bacterium]
MGNIRKTIKAKRQHIFQILALLSIIFLTVSFLGMKLTSKKSLCANSISCIKNLGGTFKTNGQRATFEGKIVAVPPKAQGKIQQVVLGEAAAEKRIEVNLTNQHLYAYEGNNLVYDFPVSTGKWSKTPTGTYRIWIKLKYTSMAGGNKDWGTDYNLPNVPYAMYFYNDDIPKTRGYGLHGTYWHNNFGHPMSHGGVNIQTENAEKLYYWADPPIKDNTTYADQENPGTKVIIYGVTPNE